MAPASSWKSVTRLSGLLLTGALLLALYHLYDTRDLHTVPAGLVHHDASTVNHEHGDLLSRDVSLVRRDDYSCGVGAPCRNGACCGESGFCGYGPTYCGDGCISQCNATAECGKYAAEPGKKCPLNVCCSQYGFCGTTELFCDKDCQSSCEEHPSPPSGDAGKVFDKVIGYYESWSDRKLCHKVSPSDLPLDALTHVNYAFAYIDPQTYQITTMDSQTPSSLFDDVTTMKSIKPDLKVWISIGGWTFSDNGTATQPVFGEIAADEGKRQTFSNNLVHFMQQHGFDGADLDWEYPGAPDRGGKKEDTANYVELLKTMRSTFKSSGGNYGITFTVPSSFWYLRWFDLPKMLEQCDWLNLMSYDLHGVWDSNNPIGSIVQGHTNLTEIQRAVELLWRVNIPPSKVALGFGFYGRSFTLADPSCTKPGCPFSGASRPGPCTDTAGYLGHYEIQQILKGGAKRQAGPKPVHDSEAAVNYLVFDNDQWISYDDDVTFKQKADWANKIGLGGSLIWASDLDDDKYTAHSAMLARTISSTNSLQDTKDLLNKTKELSLVDSVKGQTGEKCYTYRGSCQDLDDSKALADACGSGNTVVGWDDAGCGKKNHHYGKPICCPSDGAPSSCTWRGDNLSKSTGDIDPTNAVSGDCSGECEEGEINVGSIGSSWGGGFSRDGNTNKCRRGGKSFCCVAPDYSAITKRCSFTACGAKCPSGSKEMFRQGAGCASNKGDKLYCCPDPAPISDCHWVGEGGACTNVRCAANEIELARDKYGDPKAGKETCDWGRHFAACCKVGKEELVKRQSDPAYCTQDMCEAIPGYCPPVFRNLDPDAGDGDDDDDEALAKRDVLEDASNVHHKRGEPRTFTPPAGGPRVTVRSLGYPGPSKIFKATSTLRGPIFLAQQAAPKIFQLYTQYCLGPALRSIDALTNAPDPNVVDTEHALDLQSIGLSLVVSMYTGILPSGKRARLATIGQSFFDKWNDKNAALKQFARIGSQYGPQPDTINGRIMACLGSNKFRTPFGVLQKSVNIAKGKLFGFEAPVALSVVEKFAVAAVRADDPQAANTLFSSLRTGFAVFEYMNKPEVVNAWIAVNSQMRLQLSYIGQVTGLGDSLIQWWDVWLADYSETITKKGAQWATDALKISVQAVYDANQAAKAAGRPTLATTDLLVGTLGAFADQIRGFGLPALPQMPLLPAPPASSKRGLQVGYELFGEDSEETPVLELDEELWERMKSTEIVIDEELVHAHNHAHEHAHGHYRRHSL